MTFNPSGKTVCLIGSPGPASIWFQMALRDILGASFSGSVKEFVLDDDEATTSFLSGTYDAAAILIVSHFPRRDLFNFLAAQEVLTLVVVENPIITASYQAIVRSVPIFEGVRPLTQSLSLIREARALHSKLGIFSETLDLPTSKILGWLIDIIAKIRGGAVPEKAATALVEERLSSNDSLTHTSWALSLSHGVDARHLNAEEKQLVSQVCDGLVRMVRGDTEGVEMHWPVSFFFDGGTFTNPATPVMDVTGPARCLYYGPYLHLPRGRWVGEVALGFSEEMTDNYLRVEVYTDAPQIEYISRVREPGIFEMPIAFEVVDPRQPLQLRVFIDRGEISGKIGLPFVRLRPENEAT